MWFAFICSDVADSLPIRTAHRPAHRARLEELDVQGRLLVAGPFPLQSPSLDSGDDTHLTEGFSGSLIIADFDDLAAAQRWADEEPYWKAGAFDSIVVKPFRKSLPAS